MSDIFLSYSVDYTADDWNKLWATVRRYAAIYKHTPCKYATYSEKNFAQHVNVYAWSCVYLHSSEIAYVLQQHVFIFAETISI